jgi:hypothetical protein
MPTYIYKDELYHHGIKGQRWGIRRYQNYDGSYTQAGLKRYYKAEGEYNDAKANYKSTKAAYRSGNASKYDVNVAKNNYKTSKRNLNKHYKHLKQDKLGDEGKQLYAKGKRITNNAAEAARLQIATSAAAYIAYYYGKNLKVAAAIAVGGTAMNMGKALVNEYQDRRLRAYYGHSSKY